MRVHIPCNLCDADCPAPICYDNGYPIVRCRRCRLTYVAEQPLLAPGEDVGFFSTCFASEIENDPKVRMDKREVYRAGLGELSKSYPDRGRLLDVGCGFGLFLEDARSSGWQPFGVDVSEVGIRHATEELGLRDVQRRDLKDAAYPDGYFQAVTLWNILEHVPDPLATMREVRRILDPQGGIVLVRVPNMLEDVPQRDGLKVAIGIRRIL